MSCRSRQPILVNRINGASLTYRTVSVIARRASQCGASSDVLILGVSAIRYYAGMAGKISGSTVDIGESQKQVVVRKEPIGVGE